MHAQPGLAIAAGLVWFGGSLLFLGRLLRLAFRRAPLREPAFLAAE